MSDWQPIKTAPHDRSYLLLYIPDSAQEPQVVIGYGNPDDGPDDWLQSDNNSGGFLIDMPVTHWMPLPAPPSA